MSTEEAKSTTNNECTHVEKVRSDLIAGSELPANYTSPEEKRLLRKADSVILPLASLSYFASYLVRSSSFHNISLLTILQDRNSIGNARLMGLERDLGMHGNQFYDCLTMFCTSYILSS